MEKYLNPYLTITHIKKWLLYIITSFYTYLLLSIVYYLGPPYLNLSLNEDKSYHLTLLIIPIYLYILLLYTSFLYINMSLILPSYISYYYIVLTIIYPIVPFIYPSLSHLSSIYHTTLTIFKGILYQPYTLSLYLSYLLFYLLVDHTLGHHLIT